MTYDWKAVTMPPRIARLPKDPRGFPVPFTAQVLNGKADLTVIDPKKWDKALRQSLCGICGAALLDDYYFVGGEMCAANRLFTDLPMHSECATYSLQVCPFLAAPKMAYRKDSTRDAEAHRTLTSVSTERPSRFMLGHALGYELVSNGGEILLHAYPWFNLQWWKEGVCLS